MKRLVGGPPRKPTIHFHDFWCQAGSSDRPRRVVAAWGSQGEPCARASRALSGSPTHRTTLGVRITKRGQGWPGRDILRENRMLGACQTIDDLPAILECVGDDNIVIGSDYGQNDTSSELEALGHLKTMGTVDPESVDKLLGDNAQRLKGL